MNILLLALTLISASLTGCAAPLPSIHDVEPNNFTDQQALLIVSGGADETCISFSCAFIVKEVKAKPALISSIGVMALNNDFVAGDFKDEYGLLILLLEVTWV